MKRIFVSLIVVAVGGLTAAAASADSVYRCGNEYTRLPCSAGRLIDVSDEASASRRAEARDTVLREQRLGESMARERRAEAAALHPAIASSLGPAKAAAAPVPAPKKKKSAKRKTIDTGIDGESLVLRVPRSKTKAQAS